MSLAVIMDGYSENVELKKNVESPVIEDLIISAVPLRMKSIEESHVAVKIGIEKKCNKRWKKLARGSLLNPLESEIGVVIVGDGKRKGDLLEKIGEDSKKQKLTHMSNINIVLDLAEAVIQPHRPNIMNCFAWNARGLENPRAFRELRRLIAKK